MISFLIAILALIAGYFVYGRFVAHVFGPDDRATPAVRLNDGVDYIVLPTWKIFMIQFLNIAGTGPIFGAILGAKFGPASYLWIVFGCIFAGATHDYLSGMLSMRHDGAGLPQIVGHYLGRRARGVMLCFSVLLLVLVGAVFVYSPASILGGMTAPAGDAAASADWFLIWAGVIFAYYFIATMMPIDKIIGKVYPLFAISLLFMALALFVGLLVKWPTLPELWDGLANRQPEVGPIVPCLFITIACGAISGFHATQSPLMARCLKDERLGRPVFYGSMITEGIVALIWAAVSSYFFYAGGAVELGSDTAQAAPSVVKIVCTGWLGTLGAILAMLGVVAAPITSGDTALRSARLIIAEALNFQQHSRRRRLLISVPLFAVTLLLLWYNIADKDGFNTIWSYFGWANQTLAVFTLWAATVYLVHQRKLFIITLLPALFMTGVCSTYLCIGKECLALPAAISYTVGCVAVLVAVVWFCVWYARERRSLSKPESKR